MNVVLTLLAFYGVTFALRSATLLEPARLWIARRSRFARDLLACSFCTGFHSGYLVYIFLLPLPWNFRDMFLYAFAGAAWSYVVDHLAQILELEVQHRELRGPHVQPRTGDHHEVIRPPPP